MAAPVHFKQRGTQTHPDLIKHLTDLITEERHKIEEALAAIAEYSEQLKRVTEDAGQRMLSKD
jgi:hypothetical protein